MSMRYVGMLAAAVFGVPLLLRPVLPRWLQVVVSVLGPWLVACVMVAAACAAAAITGRSNRGDPPLSSGVSDEELRERSDEHLRNPRTSQPASQPANQAIGEHHRAIA